MTNEMKAFRKELRQALADYISSEGCSCCESTDDHAAAKARLGKMLNVPQYDDGSGYDFYKYRSKK